MAKKKKIDIKQVIADALEHYHKMKPSIKDSTKRQNESLLSEFYRFVDTLPARDKTMKIFSQKGLNRYKEYLIDKMERSKTDGKKRNFGVGQLNRCGSMIARLINNVLKPEEAVPNHVDWMKVEDTRREDQKGHFPLLDNEVTAIENCSGLTPAEEEYRNIFLLQIECGQRVSDLPKILTGKYRVKQGKKFKYIIISTIKENIKAHIPLRPKMRMWMEKVNSHKLITPVKFEKIVNGKGNGIYNQAIRRIVKKAGLDREIVRINSLLLEVRGPLYEEITNHAARCTFITNMLKKGVSTERLSKMTGHASDEMIKRVYAQLTEDDEINLIESDLYSDMDDDVVNIPVDSSSNNPKESASVIPKVKTETKPVSTDSESSSFFDSHKFLSYSDYIKGLNDCVEAAINDTSFLPSDIDDNRLGSTLQEDRKQFVDYLKQCNRTFDTKEDVIDFCQHIDTKLREWATQTPDYTKESFDIYRLNQIKAIIDYSKESHFKEDVIKALEHIFDVVCKENPEAFFLYQIIPKQKSISQIVRIIGVAIDTMYYMLDNRPIADTLIVDEKVRQLKTIPNWTIVFKELQTTPAARLEMLISKTNCRSSIKRVLYDSIATGDCNSFISVIDSHEEEVSILIQYAFSSLFMKEMKQIVELTVTLAQNENYDILEVMDNLQEQFIIYNPFFDNYQDEEPIPDFIYLDFRETDFLEYMLKILDFFIEWLNDAKRFAYPQEKRVFDKIQRFIEMNQGPELKQDYESFKAKQNAKFHTEDAVETIVSEEDNGENRKRASSKVNYLPVSIQNLDIDKFIRLLTEKDELNKFQPFITVLESTDNVNVATCLKHFFGTPSNTPLSFTLKWNGNSMVSLKFLIRLIANTNEDAARDNVIKVTRKKSSDGISKNVSTWKGSGDLWTPVYNVFEGCTSSILTAALGEEGTDARAINLNELETIADIYFECKK